MGRIRSEILFNRALLWLVLAYFAYFAGAARITVLIDAGLAVWNFVKSAMAFGEDA